MKKPLQLCPQNKSLALGLVLSVGLHLSVWSWRTAVRVKARHTPVEVEVVSPLNRVISPPPKEVSSPTKDVRQIHTNVRQFNTAREREGLVKEMQRKDLLNTKQFLFSGYLERIRQNLEPVWSRAILAESHTRRIPRGVDYLVVGTVQDSTGLVVLTFVVESSGDAAVDALAVGVMQGGYFPGMPKGLLDSDGYCRLYWTFRLRRT
jgi:hypothetical protein